MVGGMMFWSCIIYLRLVLSNKLSGPIDTLIQTILFTRLTTFLDRVLAKVKKLFRYYNDLTTKIVLKDVVYL